MLLKNEIDSTFYQTDWIIMQNVLRYVTEGDLNCIQYTYHFITGCILVSIIKSELKFLIWLALSILHDIAA